MSSITYFLKLILKRQEWTKGILMFLPIYAF